jgi:nucleotide-binding universal stress UspA family protein
MNDCDQSQRRLGRAISPTGEAVTRIVVGVSASPSGQAAVTWAADTAEAQGATLHLVRVWREIGWFFSMTASEVRGLRDTEEADQRVLRDAVAAVLVAHPGVRVTRVFLRGDLFDKLCDQTSRGDVLVLGSGSEPTDLIDEWLAENARGPVVVVSADGTVRSTHESVQSADA